MWTMLFLLWIVPVALGVFGYARVTDGMPAIKDNERRWLFDETKETELGFWLGLTFAALAVVFFALGLVQGLILPNLSAFWFLIAPLLTGSAIVLLLGFWLRSVPPCSGKLQKKISLLQIRAARLAETLFG